MDVRTLANDCALMTHDPSFNEITAPQWLVFIRSASSLCRNKGWLVDYEDDESIDVVASQFDYAVPLPFAYVDRLLVSETDGVTYIDPVPGEQWEIRLNDGVPKFSFVTLSYLSPGSTLKVVGQRRPTIYTSLDEQIDAGMDSFLLERALYYGFRYLGAGSSELAGWRRQMSQQSFQTSEELLRRHPQEFRMHPSATYVSGR